MTPSILSPAFRLATLRSERYRTLGLLLICACFILLNLTRGILTARHAAQIQRFSEYITFWLACGIYESFMLFLISRATRSQRPLRSWAPILNTIIECLFPTIAMFGLTIDKSYLGPYLALQSSSLIIYSFFIILSALRLSPALCILAGVVSSLGYASVYLVTLWLAPHNDNRSIFPAEVFIFSPIFLFIAGLITAAVAHQIRRHLFAALQEAETRRKLDHIEHDLQIARSIQMGLLPKKPPTIPGYDIAGWSQPADQTGGDYYDWMELPSLNGAPPKILFTIADATGHGIGPALLIAACRAYFRALASHNDPLESITAQVDALLAADVPVGRFITAAIALLDPQHHQLLLYSAGHAPLYLYTASTNQVTQFDSDQPPLGISFQPGPGDAPSRARILPFAPGDALILVTDGFFECANPAGDLLGTDRLADSIQSHHALTAPELIQKLHADVLAFSQSTPQSDDLTALIIKRT